MRLRQRIDYDGGDWTFAYRLYLLFTGWMLTAFSLGGILVWSNTFFNFWPASAFTDFSSIWYLPLVLQGPVVQILLAMRHTKSQRWLFVTIVFTVVCLAIALVQFASAVYGAVVIYAPTIYTGSNGWYQVGIYVAVFVSLGILLFEIFHLICACFLVPRRYCRALMPSDDDND